MVDAIRITDKYLQEQLEKVLRKNFETRKPSLKTNADRIQILFNGNRSTDDATVAKKNAATTTTSVDTSNQLNVSYCYATKEWRCLYRCEIDSSASNTNPSEVNLTLFGSVNNPTEEDWNEVELKLVANELEILNNNKTTTAPITNATREETRRETPSSGGSMQLYIKTLTGKTVTIDVCFFILVVSLITLILLSLGFAIGYDRICQTENSR